MRIGELSAATGSSTKALRFYETAGLIPPPERSANGYRHYDRRAADRVDFIRRGRNAGLTLAQIREILALRDAGTTPCAHVQQTLSDHVHALDEQIVELTALRQTVAELHARDVQPVTCDPDSICGYL